MLFILNIILRSSSFDTSYNLGGLLQNSDCGYFGIDEGVRNQLRFMLATVLSLGTQQRFHERLNSTHFNSFQP
ncbi:hypothetical protein BofuT4_uP093930.1 [Botrytis cinerea T4]|uniref:Uncharacterized protein n=1 Tax=Botryotinia fuckeliana (strain T4) TaxID=999810 RepID=G2YD37_BOTF4|nr:hypothetical protein BofuT4_uP093930.1 [Botrytis cinerea T4]